MLLNMKKIIFLIILLVSILIIISIGGFIILDVRSQEEYNEGHIPNAINIPDYEIEERANSELKDKNQVILVYCRSGYRSELSAKKLSQMGYIKIYNFGGIIDWPYDIESFQ